MKIMIQFGYDYLGIEANGQAGAILAALETAKIYHSDYTGKKYVPKGTMEKPEPIKVEIVQDEYLADATPMIDKLTEELKAAESRWLDYYTKYNATQKELGELKTKIEQFNKKEGE